MAYTLLTMLSTTIAAMASSHVVSGSACLKGGPQSMAFCTVRVVTLSEGVQTARQRGNVIGTAHDRCASTARLSRRIRAQSLDGWDRTGSHGHCLALASRAGHACLERWHHRGPCLGQCVVPRRCGVQMRAGPSLGPSWPSWEPRHGKGLPCKGLGKFQWCSKCSYRNRCSQ